jgi:nucleotide-binding universal stress UspA family protein
MFTRVLVPLDGTEAADSIIPYVSSLAQGLGMEVVLISVTDPDAIVLHSNDEQARLRNVSQILANAENHLNSRHQAAISTLESAGVTARGMVTQGAPAEEILRVSQEEGCDLIAMSTQGRLK